jgi:signal transduction histidine kinase
MSRKARDILDVFEDARRPVMAVPLVALLDRSITTVGDDHSDVPIACGSVPGVTVSNVLAPVFSNAIENAAEHNTSSDPWVRIDAERDGDVVRVVVRDNGPTIDSYERSVLERGTETPLEHASGLGLWLIAWGTQIAEGTVTFSENDPTGSVVTVEAPVLGESTAVPRNRLGDSDGADTDGTLTGTDNSTETDTRFDSSTDATMPR